MVPKARRRLLLKQPEYNQRAAVLPMTEARNPCWTGAKKGKGKAEANQLLQTSSWQTVTNLTEPVGSREDRTR